MQYVTHYESPLGIIFLQADDIGLTGLWFYEQKYFPEIELKKSYIKTETPFFKSAWLWLNTYFSKKEPDFTPPLHLIGTEFQQKVWKILLSIPYGKTITYGEIARALSKQNEENKMSAQAVGGAVGKNKISIIVPCHRVLGANGALVGYAGGIEKKARLLELEGIKL